MTIGFASLYTCKTIVLLLVLLLKKSHEMQRYAALWICAIKQTIFLLPRKIAEIFKPDRNSIQQMYTL